MNSSIHIWHIKNLMNETDIFNIGGGPFLPVTQYTQTTITVELDNAFLAHGQLVSIVGEIVIADDKHHFEAVAKLIASEVIVDSLVQFEFQLKQLQTTLWKSFLESKSQAQNHVDQLLRKMKGLD